jgi:foldase protein PrsA
MTDATDHTAPSPAEPGSDASVAVPRRAATPRAAAASAQAGRKSSPLLIWGVALLALFIGLVIGVFGMRARYNAKEVVFSVNGVTVDKNTFFDRLQRAAGVPVARALVGEQLQLQFAEKEGVLPTDEEVEARFQELAKRKNFKENLQRQGLTEEQFKSNLKLTMAQANVLTKGVKVTEAEIREFYRRNSDPKNPTARFYLPETVQLAVIVTRTEEDARKALADLNRGIAWSTVVKNYSLDDSKENDGVLPPTVRGRTRASTIPGLEDAVFGMKVGDRIGPRQFAGGWWIIRCLDKRPAQKIPFQEVRTECEVGAKLVKAGPETVRKVEAKFAEFQKNAEIKAFWPQYAEAVKTK